MKKLRIDKYLVKTGFCSTRKALHFVKNKQVTLNGQTAQLNWFCRPQDDVRVDGVPIEWKEPQRLYIAYYKPIGLVCADDPNEKDNVYRHVSFPERVFPVGRLDKDSEGLLLFTNDGAMANRIIHADQEHEKEYHVVVTKPLQNDTCKKLAAGVKILDTVTKPCEVVATGPNAMRFVLRQGLNRQIRRMCQTLGYQVLSLKRVRVLHIILGELKPGEFRLLNEEEMQPLLALEQK